jgi:hypothetical protein
MNKKGLDKDQTKKKGEILRNNYYFTLNKKQLATNPHDTQKKTVSLMPPCFFTHARTILCHTVLLLSRGGDFLFSFFGGEGGCCRTNERCKPVSSFFGGGGYEKEEGRTTGWAAVTLEEIE